MPPPRPVPKFTGLPKIRDVVTAVGKSCYENLRELAKGNMQAINDLRPTAEDKLVNKMVLEERYRRQENKNRGLPPTYYPDAGLDHETVKNTRYNRILGTDIEASEISMGMSAAAGNYRNVGEDVAIQAVREAYRLGINYFDTAPLYGYDRSGEYLLGRALRDKPRNSYYVSTKVGRYLEEIPDTILGGTRHISVENYTAEKTIESVHKSLELLGVDYLDIVFVHDMQFSDSYKMARNSCLGTLSSLRQQGLIRYVGLSSYDLSLMATVFKDESYLKLSGEGIPRVCDVFQCVGRYNMLDRTVTSTKAIPYRFLEHTISYSIGLINAAPLNMGLFTPGGPPVWHSAPQEVRECCKQIVDICTERGVDVVRVALFFSLRQKALGTHLVGLATPQEVYNAVSVMHSSITEEEATCLNIALGMIEELDRTTWRERDAIITATGAVSDKAKGSRIMDDKSAVASGLISGRGEFKFHWRTSSGGQPDAPS